MELLDLPQLAERAGIPVSLVRYYRDRFVLFVPSVRIGRTVVHPPEAVPVMQRIHAEAGKGAGIDAIIQVLEAASPISITSAQPLADGQAMGAAGVINNLASAFDQRGERIAHELSALRAQIAEATSAPAIDATRGEPQHDLGAAVGHATAEIAALSEGMAELRLAVGQLASRDQMEWIGDVVAAAVIAPQVQPPDSGVEQRLAELMQEIRRLRPSTEAAELRVAVERLTDYVHHRDAELRRAFQTLVATLRAEVRVLRTGMDELRHLAGGEPEPALPGPIPFPTLNGAHDTISSDVHDEADNAESSIEALRSRSPRRLGQVTKPSEAATGEPEAANGSGNPPAKA